MRILYAENDENSRRAQGAFMGRAGFEMLVCNTEAEARRLIEDTRADFELAVFDMRMEDRLSGLRLVQQLVANRPDVPAVVLTAFASIEDYARCTEAGAFSYVEKDEATTYLIPTLRRATRRRVQNFRESFERAVLKHTVARLQAAVGPNGLGAPEAEAILALIDLRWIMESLASLPPVPDDTAPGRPMAELVPPTRVGDIALAAAPEVPATTAELRTWLVGAPDWAKLVPYLVDHGWAAPLDCCVECRGQWFTIRLSSGTGSVTTGAVQRLRELLNGRVPSDEEESRVALFALQLTSLAATACVRTDGPEAHLEIRLLTA